MRYRCALYSQCRNVTAQQTADAARTEAENKAAAGTGRQRTLQTQRPEAARLAAWLQQLRAMQQDKANAAKAAAGQRLGMQLLKADAARDAAIAVANTAQDTADNACRNCD